MKLIKSETFFILCLLNGIAVGVLWHLNYYSLIMDLEPFLLWVIAFPLTGFIPIVYGFSLKKTNNKAILLTILRTIINMYIISVLVLIIGLAIRVVLFFITVGLP